MMTKQPSRDTGGRFYMYRDMIKSNISNSFGDKT